MSVATTAYKDDPKMRADLDEISADVLAAAFKTDFGQEYLDEKEARAFDKGRETGRKAHADEVYRKLLGVMSEDEARRLSGYTGQ